MKTSSEKEKKLDTALSKLIDLNLNANLKENLQHLGYQKNQLEIEKKEEQSKVLQFSEKIDELNQETDTLLEDIDKWQM